MGSQRSVVTQNKMVFSSAPIRGFLQFFVTHGLRRFAAHLKIVSGQQSDVHHFLKITATAATISANPAT